jgi:CHAD domain-containing protein
MNMQEYARSQTAALLRRLAFEVNRAAKSCDEEAVHDLRVAVRRLSRCQQVFSQFYPDGSAKKIRLRMKALMQPAGAVRDLDIAMDLVADAGIDRKAHLSYRMAVARRQAKRDLEREVRRWKGSSFFKKWRSALGLNA